MQRGALKTIYQSKADDSNDEFISRKLFNNRNRSQIVNTTEAYGYVLWTQILLIEQVDPTQTKIWNGEPASINNLLGHTGSLISKIELESARS